MHDGCSGTFQTGQQVVDKVRMMGFSDGALPLPHNLTCDCGTKFTMEFFEDKCPSCGMIFAVTPCSCFDPNLVQKAGKDY